MVNIYPCNILNQEPQSSKTMSIVNLKNVTGNLFTVACSVAFLSDLFKIKCDQIKNKADNLV